MLVGAAETWQHSLVRKQESLRGIGIYGDPGLAEAVSKDIYGIGFSNTNYVYDINTGKNALAWSNANRDLMAME